ncbi:DNA ligase [Comamonas resistens]|uniref:DNA ligase n=1 Tax=Comamonas resistens TaxID=3046670 RepID=A0ABY8SWD8_9BURK|nr:DNA ligase [Comamonas resistens]MDL5037945.1 DNA ligase [Comamonas resistens]WHS67364.1 DNA ligase [Comamonas resistens]
MHPLSWLRKLLGFIFLGLWLSLACAQTATPPLMLAQVWRTGMPLQDYWVSEKYDGVRGYWDGRQLLSRGGIPIKAPAWFTAGWPSTPMDGELWAGRGQFGHAQSTTAQTAPDDAAWQRMRFMVFDLPTAPGNFDQRLPVLQRTVAALDQSWVQAVEQRKLGNEAELQQWLMQIVKNGGEGLVLHKGSAPYRSGRSDDLLKLKPFDDAEARVIGYKPGRGQWQGMTGALLVQSPDGKQFSLGSGLSAELRRSPPPLGSWVTYRYQGLHEKSGLPRFARFMRVRNEPGFEPSSAPR